MQFLNVLLITSSFIVFIIPHCQGNCDEVSDADLCLDEPRYGKGKICYFAYMNDYEHPEIMYPKSCGDAVQYHEGVLHDYKKTFVAVFENDNEELMWLTLGPESGQNVKGMTYLMRKEVFIGQFVLSPEGEVEGKRVITSGKFTIEVTIDGKKENICCNTVIAKPME